jgi:hypothetical protein
VFRQVRFSLVRLSAETVFRYWYPLTVTSTGGRFPAASCSMAFSGTTMPMLLPVTATVVWNVTLLGCHSPSCLSPAGIAFPDAK